MSPCESCPFAGCPGCEWQGGPQESREAGAEGLAGLSEGEGLGTGVQAVTGRLRRRYPHLERLATLQASLQPPLDPTQETT